MTTESSVPPRVGLTAENLRAYLKSREVPHDIASEGLVIARRLVGEMRDFSQRCRKSQYTVADPEQAGAVADAACRHLRAAGFVAHGSKDGATVTIFARIPEPAAEGEASDDAS